MFKVINLIPFEKRSNYLMNKLEDVSIIIKTLERKIQLFNLLYSIRKLKFKGLILIADDSKQPYEKEVLELFPDLKIIYFSMPYDSGTSEGRNLMLSHVKTPYFILCDDDFIFEPRTRIPYMRKLLIDNNLDILGGVFIEYWAMNSFDYWRNKLARKLFKYKIIIPPTHKYEYTGNINIEGKICKILKVDYKDPFINCDLTHNFFIANTDKVKKIRGWNPILKGGEHHNFFIKAKLNNLRVGSTRRCGVIHDRDVTPCSDEYKTLRSRDKNYQKVALEEFGLEKLEHFTNVSFG